MLVAKNIFSQAALVAFVRRPDILVVTFSIVRQLVFDPIIIPVDFHSLAVIIEGQ